MDAAPQNSPSSPWRKIADVDVLVEGTGEPIVMVHGWPDTYRLWDAQAAFLKDRHRCIRFTLPGFDIAQPRQAYSLEALVETLKQIVEATCPGEQVTLMLHDWGCVFGYQFAMRHPALIRRVIGVDIGDVGSRAHLRAMRAKDKFMVFAYQFWLALAWKIGGVSGGALGDRMTRAMARWARCPSDPQYIGSHMCYPYYIRWFGAHGSYRGILPFRPTWPMLYFYGRRKLFQFQSRDWVDALNARPGCRALEFDTGHWVMRARPQEFNQAVAQWLDEAATAKPG